MNGGTLDEVKGDLAVLPDSELPPGGHEMDMWRRAATVVRDCARIAGVDLGPPPFFLSPQDPEYERIITEGASANRGKLN